MLNKSNNCRILQISGCQVLSPGQVWALVMEVLSMTVSVVIGLKTRGPEGQALCLSLGSTALSSSVTRMIYSANFNWLFADTKYLLNVNNNKLEIVTFGNLSFVNSETLEICQQMYCTMPEKSLFSLIMTQILDSRLTECPVLLYLAEKYLQRNELCLLLTLKELSTILFPLNWMIVPCCIVVSTIKPFHSCNWFQNAAAMLLTGERNRDHISPVLASFHQPWKEVTSKYCCLFMRLYMILQHIIFHNNSYTTPLHPLGLLVNCSTGWLCF